jgi:phosphoglycolate phosphatase-like HAD superfamily hydrolase
LTGSTSPSQGEKTGSTPVSRSLFSSMYKTIIYDFDGTLVDSTQLVSSIFKTLQKKFNLNHLTTNDIKHFKQKSLKQQLAA